MIVAILLGRAGSSGFPGKNLHPILGRPLVAYPLMATNTATTVDRVYVSTDSPAIAEVARSLGCEVIQRPAELATKAALAEDAYTHALGVIRAATAEPIELVVTLFANAPTLTAAMIDEGVRVLRDNPHYDSAVSASVYNMFSPLRARRIGDDGLLQPFVPLAAFGDISQMNCDRDSQGDCWIADAALVVTRPRWIEHPAEGQLPQRWMGQNIYPLKNWAGIDVDYEWQMPQVEFWLRQHGFAPASE